MRRCRSWTEGEVGGREWCGGLWRAGQTLLIMLILRLHIFNLLRAAFLEDQLPAIQVVNTWLRRFTTRVALISQRRGQDVNADGNSDFVSFAFPSLALPTSLASSFSSVTGHSGSDGELGFNSNSVYASGGGYVPQVHAFLAASTVDVVDISAVPIPAVGTGLPGLLLAGGGLLAWWRRRMWI